MAVMNARRRLSLAALLAWAAGLAAVQLPPGPAAAASASLQLVPVLTGLSSPLFVTNARDGSDRLFVVEQGGLIKVLRPGSPSPTVFLDLSGTILSGRERGLLGLAFHPAFPVNSRFFVNYTRQPDGATVIAEYHASLADPDVADPTGTVILTIPQPAANHNGGMLAFGPDGFLHVGMGDGGASPDPAQDVASLLGKILRIDVDHPDGGLLYSSPSDNPFAGATPGRDEIFAVGMRNPFRFSFDRLTGELYVGDVGQNTIEEVDIVTPGANYGWGIWEGSRCNDPDPGACTPEGFTFPITEYAHALGRCAVTGGYVYRGAQATVAAGTYVFGDLCSGEIFAFRNGVRSVALDSGLTISSFGEDEAGEIYVVGIGGTVHRIASSGCSVSLGAASASIRAGGAPVAAVGVTAEAGCAWSAVSNDPWVGITRGSGQGRGFVVYSVASNLGGASPRTGTFTVGAQTFSVNQAGAPCLASVTPVFDAYGPAGGAGSVTVAVPAGCAWTAASTVGWIKIKGAASGSGGGTVRYLVEPNAGPVRVGAITVAGRTVTVLSF